MVATDRFAALEGLDEALAGASTTPPRWEIRGPDAVLCGALGPGIRVEVVPLDARRALARVEGIVSREALADWLRGLAPARAEHHEVALA